MPNIKGSEKRMRQQRTREARNRAQRSRMRTAIKRVMSATDAGEATEAYRETVAILDRYASRRLIHPKKAARKKSQLAKKVAELGGQP
ncbi:MAG TPA: 30S ribosomal protein S20 [Longimicrobiales bacterium]|nr:30S ribosomal protein S20 [Longimicrobiales bacterium]